MLKLRWYIICKNGKIFPKAQRERTFHSGVISMDTRARLLAIRLLEAIRKDPGYARTLGIEARMTKRIV